MGIEYNASMYMEFKILKFYLMTFQITTDSSEKRTVSDGIKYNVCLINFFKFDHTFETTGS